MSNILPLSCCITYVKKNLHGLAVPSLNCPTWAPRSRHQTMSGPYDAASWRLTSDYLLARGPEIKNGSSDDCLLAHSLARFCQQDGTEMGREAQGAPSCWWKCAAAQVASCPLITWSAGPDPCECIASWCPFPPRSSRYPCGQHCRRAFPRRA